MVFMARIAHLGERGMHHWNPQDHRRPDHSERAHQQPLKRQHPKGTICVRLSENQINPTVPAAHAKTNPAENSSHPVPERSGRDDAHENRQPSRCRGNHTDPAADKQRGITAAIATAAARQSNAPREVQPQTARAEAQDIEAQR